MTRRPALLALLLLASPARAGERSASFTVGVTVVRPFYLASTATVTLISTATGAVRLAEGGAALVRTRAGRTVVTVFPDGAPTALIER